MKYYAVKAGNNPGLFDNWPECQESIKGFSGAVYKSFNSIFRYNIFYNMFNIRILTQESFFWILHKCKKK